MEPLLGFFTFFGVALDIALPHAAHEIARIRLHALPGEVIADALNVALEDEVGFAVVVAKVVYLIFDYPL